MLDLQKLRKLTLDEKTATKFYGRFTAEPFEIGYGHTIGNSLRRVLLSSLKGAAITSVKINGALHEFAVLKGIKEDVAHIILNLKKIRFQLHSEGSERLYLRVKKGGQITAADIEKNASVEIMNPEQEIANLDNSASLEMELEVSIGTGYVLADEFKSSKYAVGTILLDVLFSPIVKVNYEVENTRVEQTLNYDKLIIEIWSDGSVSPSDALKESAKILQNSLSIFVEEEKQEDIDEAVPQEEAQETVKEEKGADSPISSLELSSRAEKALKNANIETIGALLKVSIDDLESFENLGKRSIEEIKKKIEKLGLSLSE